jgi:serine/threonine protein kinase
MKERPDIIGRVLSERYRVDAVIASGSFGSVYRGVHLHMHKAVAIKILHPEVENFPELVERFEREAVAGAHITHPNVAVASDLGKFDGDSYFLVQEYVPGQTLREVMTAGAMKADRAAFIARQIAEGLGAAHKHKIIHRDLKPMNIMIVEGTDDVVKLIDFGFARVPVDDLPQVPSGHQGPNWEQSQHGVVFGSVSYMAPDAFLGMQNVDERSDLYALGIILYEMLAGEHPFDIGLPAAELFDLQRNAKPPALKERNPACDAPADLEYVVMRLLAKAPEERYQDAAAVSAAIDAAMKGFHSFLARRESNRPPPGGLPKPDESSHRRMAMQRSARAPRPNEWVERFNELDPKFKAAVIAGALVVVVFLFLGVRSLFVGTPATPTPSATVLASAPTAVKPITSAPTSTAKPPAPPSARAKFLKAADGPANVAFGAWLSMNDADKAALEDPAVQAKTAALLGEADPSDEVVTKVFDDLSYRTGSAGLDILFRVLEESPASAIAQKSGPILIQQAQADRASPALRITLDLRRMNCSRKLRQFEKAGEEGDERTLRELEKLHPPNCVVQKGQCCFKEEPRLEKALASIRERTKSNR